MNDNTYLRSIKDLEQVGSKMPEEVKEVIINGLSPVSKMEVLDKGGYEQLRQDLISLGYSKDKVSRDFSELYFGDVTPPADFRID